MHSQRSLCLILKPVARIWGRRYLVGVICLILSAQGFAESEVSDTGERQERPKWEVGLGGGYFGGFDYPASSDSNHRALVLPYLIYRTPRWRFGDGGVRAVGIERSRIKLDIAASFSLGASSSDDNARAGLPDLDYLFEIGPQLEISLLNKELSSGGRVLVRFTSELRTVLGTDFRKGSSRGFVAEAGIGINYRNVRHTGIDLLGALSSSYASERMQDYFYEVSPDFATDLRPEYDANAGYLGSRLFVGLGFRPLSNVRVFIGAFTGFYGGAKNQESPLFETKRSTSYVLGMTWALKSSKVMVETVDLGGNN